MGSIVADTEITGSRLEAYFDVRPETGEIFYRKRPNRHGGESRIAGFLKPGDPASGGGYRVISFPVSHRAYRRIRRIQSNNKSGYKWVYWCPQRKLWKADIRDGNGSRKLAFYCCGEDPKEVHAKACEAAKRIFGDFYNPGDWE